LCTTSHLIYFHLANRLFLFTSWIVFWNVQTPVNPRHRSVVLARSRCPTLSMKTCLLRFEVRSLVLTFTKVVESCFVPLQCCGWISSVTYFDRGYSASDHYVCYHDHPSYPTNLWVISNNSCFKWSQWLCSKLICECDRYVNVRHDYFARMPGLFRLQFEAL
jgi:hypothetical protein